MTDKQKLELAVEALKDISTCLTSLARQDRKPKDEALKLFSDTFVTIANISESAQKQITLQ